VAAVLVVTPVMVVRELRLVQRRVLGPVVAGAVEPPIAVEMNMACRVGVLVYMVKEQAVSVEVILTGRVVTALRT
jgi:hypothetical protein